MTAEPYVREVLSMVILSCFLGMKQRFNGSRSKKDAYNLKFWLTQPISNLKEVNGTIIVFRYVRLEIIVSYSEYYLSSSLA